MSMLYPFSDELEPCHVNTWMQFLVRIRTRVNDVESFVIQFVEHTATDLTRTNDFQFFDDCFRDFAFRKIWFC